MREMITSTLKLNDSEYQLLIHLAAKYDCTPGELVSYVLKEVLAHASEVPSPSVRQPGRSHETTREV